jgi:hypothetical protein
MTKASDEFEILISRVYQLIEREGASVEWNEKIPDPDNPKQGRQIDILIRKNGLTNFVECRLHKDPQDVQWIEELIGRRVSLEANAIVGVSSSGFTEGAIRKAAKHGVVLNDINHLSDDEIRSWSRSIGISIFYYKYEDFKLSLIFDNHVSGIDCSKLQKELKNHKGFRSLFTAQLDLLEEQKLIVKGNRNKRVNFHVKFNIEDFVLCNRAVKEVWAEGVASLEEKRLMIPEVLAYGEPCLENDKRSVYIQKFNMGETSVVHHDGHISVTLDLSGFEAPPYWQFRYVTVSSEHEDYMDSLELLYPEKIIMSVDKINLNIIGIENQPTL